MPNMVNVRIQGQPQLEKIIEGLPGALDVVAILDEGAAVLYNRMRTRFLQEVAPDGHQWPRSQAAIRREKLGVGGGTLFDTGKLFRSIQLFADSETTRSIGTDATSDKGFPYPVFLQYYKDGQWQFIGFGDQDVKYMSDLVLQRLTQQLEAL